MPTIEAYVEHKASIDFDCQCSVCGYDLYREVAVKDTTIYIDPCPKCMEKLNDEIETLKEQLNQS